MELMWEVFVYVLYTLPLFMIAKKSEHPYAWLAFVPLANLWLMCDMADKDVWWIILFFVPLINIIVYIAVWMALAENTNKPAWLGILMIFPIIGLITAYYLAFYEPKTSRY